MDELNATQNMYLTELLDGHMAFEKGMSDFYRELHGTVADDGFWWQLSLEESNHAALIYTKKEFLAGGFLPKEIVFPSRQMISAANSHLQKIRTRYQQRTPTLAQACATALALEESPIEAHLRRLATNTPSPFLDLLERLNGHDKDHADRIRAYARSRGLAIPTRGARLFSAAFTPYPL